MARLWFAIGNLQRASKHAIEAYKWAWADGEPYARMRALRTARSLLLELGTEIPNLPLYDGSRDPKFGGEDALEAAIVEFRSSNIRKTLSIFRGPFVAVIGGFWALKENTTELDEGFAYSCSIPVCSPFLVSMRCFTMYAIKMAFDLGDALANAGLGIVVYFSDHESLEPHLVSGYVKAVQIGDIEKCVRVRLAESQKNEVRFAEYLVRSELFDLKKLCTSCEVTGRLAVSSTAGLI